MAKKAPKMQVATRKWIDALRSGKYSQTQGKLRDKETGGMCCLGVAADTIAPSAWLKTATDEEELPFRDTNGTGYLKEKDFNRILPVNILEHLIDEYGISISQDEFSALNDEYGYTFPMIADVIESFWSNEPVDITYTKNCNKFRDAWLEKNVVPSND